MRKGTLSLICILLAMCLFAGSVSAFADEWDTEPICLEHSYSRVTVEPATPESDGYTVLQCRVCHSNKSNSSLRIAQIASVTLSQEVYRYDGTEKKPLVVVKDVDNKTIAAKNYTVEYFENIYAGRDTYVLVTFKGNYAGSIRKSFSIVKDTGAVCGCINTEQFYHPAVVELYLDDTMVSDTMIENDGTFFVDDLAPGTYSAKLYSINSPVIEITDITVEVNSVINLNESENAFLQDLRLALGDINGDGVIDFADASVILANDIYGSDRNNGWYEECIDLNGDGLINVLDIGVLLQEGNYSAYKQVFQY